MDCYICDRINLAEADKNPEFIARLRTGYVFLNTDGQYYRGYSLFSCKQCVPELHLLDEEFRSDFLWEMSLVAKALFYAVQPAKLNYALLGNISPHLHWHIIPRCASDPMISRPVWENEEYRRRNAEVAALGVGSLASDVLTQLKLIAPERIERSHLDARR